MDCNTEKIVVDMIKNQCYEGLKERALAKPMPRAALQYIERASSVDEIIGIMLKVINTQDEAVEEIMESLIDAEKRAFPKPMFVPDGHTIVGDDK